MSKGFGKMEQAILAVLPPDGKTWRVRYIAYDVAEQLGWGIWTRTEHMARLKAEHDAGNIMDDLYYSTLKLCRIIQRRQARRHLTSVFIASFSRALKRLEQKGLVNRYQKTALEVRDGAVYLILSRITGSPRCSKTVEVGLAIKNSNISENVNTYKKGNRQ